MSKFKKNFIVTIIFKNFVLGIVNKNYLLKIILRFFNQLCHTEHFLRPNNDTLLFLPM